MNNIINHFCDNKGDLRFKAQTAKEELINFFSKYDNLTSNLDLKTIAYKIIDNLLKDFKKKLYELENNYKDL